MFQTDDEADDDADEDEIIFTELHEVLQDDSEKYVLPPHHQCASHTLNLICTNDMTAKSSLNF